MGSACFHLEENTWVSVESSVCCDAEQHQILKYTIQLFTRVSRALSHSYYPRLQRTQQRATTNPNPPEAKDCCQAGHYCLMSFPCMVVFKYIVVFRDHQNSSYFLIKYRKNSLSDPTESFLTKTRINKVLSLLWSVLGSFLQTNQDKHYCSFTFRFNHQPGYSA